MWVFGYGSLIWNPGFVPAARELAVLPGWHRSFCMRSIHHRGSPEAPGLVLALDDQADATCTGLALKVSAGEEDDVLTYLRDRELISSAYLEQRHRVRIAAGEVEAVTFVVDRHHVQYCGGLPLAEQAAIIARAVGGRGRNIDYLVNTHAHLAALGIADPDLDWLVAEAGRLDRAAAAAAGPLAGQ